jgi:hypothetical protein
LGRSLRYRRHVPPPEWPGSTVSTAEKVGCYNVSL